MLTGSEFQSGVLLAVIAGPILLGMAAWAVRAERIRNVIVMTAALLTASLGILMARGGPFVLQAGPWAGHLATGLEFGVIALVAGIGLRFRIWTVVGMTALQFAMAVYELIHGGAEQAGAGFVLDSLSTILVLIISIVGSAIVVFGIGYMHRHEHHAPPTAATTGRFFFFLTGFLGLMNGLVLTDSLKWLSIFWECTTLCSFFLIGHDRTTEARQNARRALVFNMIGGVAMTAAAVIFAHEGGNGTVSGLISSGSPVTIVLPILLLLIAAFTKSAQLPFQSWLLGAMVAPTPVSALLHSSTMVKAGCYLVLRLSPAFLGTSLAPMVALAGGFTFAITSAIAISQSNAKKVLAYSTIANLGLIIACAGINSPLAYTAALILLVYHAVSKALLFLCVGTIEQQIGSRDIDDMAGIMFKMPMTTTIAIVGMISMMAPPFGMLVGKWMAIVAAGHSPLVVLLFVLGSALTVFFWAKWMGRITTTSYHEHYTVESMPATMRGALIFLGTAVVVGGAASMAVYKQWLQPIAVNALANVTVQPGSDTLMKSVDDYMSWAMYPILIVAVIVGLASMISWRKTQVRLPFLCGENVGTESKGFEFRSLLDGKNTAHVTSYYFAPLFGETVITRWANPVAFLILLSFFARISLI
jgi:ech hydrogenase subunit A